MPSRRDRMRNSRSAHAAVASIGSARDLCIADEIAAADHFDEILRVVDSLQLTAKHKVSTPVNWKHGEDVIISGSVSEDEAKKTYPSGWKSPKPYIRIVPQPK